MCVGIPMRVVEAHEQVAVCEGRGRRERLDVQLVGAQPVGGWVLAFQGVAVRALSAAEAAETNAALDALEAVLAGAGAADTDAHFADLIGREPQLPDHLKGPR
jgi:hydrogenase expression/formation protein HypC